MNYHTEPYAMSIVHWSVKYKHTHRYINEDIKILVQNLNFLQKKEQNDSPPLLEHNFGFGTNSTSCLYIKDQQEEWIDRTLSGITLKTLELLIIP